MGCCELLIRFNRATESLLPLPSPLLHRCHSIILTYIREAIRFTRPHKMFVKDSRLHTVPPLLLPPLQPSPSPPPPSPYKAANKFANERELFLIMITCIIYFILLVHPFILPILARYFKADFACAVAVSCTLQYTINMKDVCVDVMDTFLCLGRKERMGHTMWARINCIFLPFFVRSFVCSSIRAMLAILRLQAL